MGAPWQGSKTIFLCWSKPLECTQPEYPIFPKRSKNVNLSSPQLDFYYNLILFNKNLKPQLKNWSSILSELLFLFLMHNFHLDTATLPHCSPKLLRGGKKPLINHTGVSWKNSLCTTNTNKRISVQQKGSLRAEKTRIFRMKNRFF